jgi:hypothetical protein
MTTDRNGFESMVAGRLENLEGQYRRMKGILAVLLILAFVATAAAVSLFVREASGARKFRTVEARRFILVDESGQMRAKLSVDEHEERDGVVRSEPGSRLGIYDGGGKLRASLWADDGGSAGLLLFDAARDQDRVALWAFQDGSALYFHDHKGTKSAELVATPKDRGVRLFDHNGKVLFSKP